MWANLPVWFTRRTGGAPELSPARTRDRTVPIRTAHSNKASRGVSAESPSCGETQANTAQPCRRVTARRPRRWCASPPRWTGRCSGSARRPSPSRRGSSTSPSRGSCASSPPRRRPPSPMPAPSSRTTATSRGSPRCGATCGPRAPSSVPRSQARRASS